MDTIVSAGLERAVGYKKYRDIVTALLEDGKSSGHVQSDDLTHYLLLNQTRMNRLEKTLRLDDESVTALNTLSQSYKWLVISEGWCGDAAQLLPIMNLLADNVANIDLKILFRDDNPELMDLFLTNGSRSIPKLIVVDPEKKVVGHWGPRPKGAAELIARHKAEKGVVDEEAKTALQMWYLHDKGISTQQELAALMLQVDSRT